MPQWIEKFAAIALCTEIKCKPDYYNLKSIDEILEYVQAWDIKSNNGKYSSKTNNSK